MDGSYKELLFCFKFTTFRNQTKWPRSRTSSVSTWLHVKALLTTNRLYTEGKAVSWARSQWNAHEPDVIWFLDEQPDIISPGSRATAAGTRGSGSPHVSAPLVERKQQTALVKLVHQTASVRLSRHSILWLLINIWFPWFPLSLY